MRTYEDMEYIIPKSSYKEAKELVKQCKDRKTSTCCVVIAGHRAKTKAIYEELQKEYHIRKGYTFSTNEFPWIVAWKYGCGHLWKSNT